MSSFSLRISRRSLSLLAAAVLLSACGGTKLVGRTLPDETQVIDGPSLALPPDFQLRPPRQATDYEAVLRAQKSAEAQQLITGVSETSVTANNVSSTTAEDSWLVQQAGAQSGVAADPNVRQALEADATVPPAPKTPLERLFGKSDKKE